MALLFMDGFGGQDGAFKYDAGSTSYTTSNATPRVPGGYYAIPGNTGDPLYKTIPSSSRVFAAAGFNVRSNYLAVSFFGDTGLTQHITVTRNVATNLLEIRRGSMSGTLLATGVTPVFLNQWNYVEVSATISDTVGEVHVRLNGGVIDEVSYTGDTKNGGTATVIDRVSFYGGSGPPAFISDLYVLNDTGTTNNNFLGDVAVRTLSPNGNGTYSQLTGSDGNSVDNYLLVDEHPYSGTDYVGSATVGQKDSYALANLPAGVTTVHGVQITGQMAKNDATLASARYMLRSGGTDYGGTTRNLTTSYTGYFELYETNPITSANWTVADVNGLETGMEVV